MPSYIPAKINTAYIDYVSLPDQADTKLMKANPTIAAGDFKVSIDGGTLNNLTTLPTVTPAAGKLVKISLSAAEMNGDNIKVVCSDAAGAEWCDVVLRIQTSANQLDDMALAASFPEVIKKNTAITDFMFKMVLASDDKTAATGLSPTCQRFIDGAAIASMANSPTEMSNGWYKINLAAADTNGDFIVYRFSAATANVREYQFKTAA